MDKLIFFTIAILVSTSAHSYLGPGMGGGIIAAVIGIFAAIFIALFGILVQCAGLIYGIVNKAEDIIIMCLIFMFVSCLPLFDKKK